MEQKLNKNKLKNSVSDKQERSLLNPRGWVRLEVSLGSGMKMTLTLYRERERELVEVIQGVGLG
jgi:hypothetical protein